MLAVGDTLPEANVWLAPREELSLPTLHDEGPILLLPYLFDWSAT
jgi:hypothetical protein